VTTTGTDGWHAVAILGGMTQPGAPQLACPLCGNNSFDREEGRLDSKWGVTSHRLTLMICQRCRYILHFYDRHSIFDFD
jgi:predicted nucleic-acid-binding Zn-ribbon protein